MPVAARVAEVADGARELVRDGLEDGIELRHLARAEDLLFLTVLGEERHLLRPRLELGSVAIEVERALRDGVVLEPLGPHELVHHRLAVLAEAELDERVAPGALRRALPEEA